MKQPFEIKSRVRLADFDPAYCDGRDKDESKEETRKLAARIGELQPKLYANGKNGIVVLLQGLDASGKDGTARKLLEQVNPAGVETTSFKVPSSEEKAHDYLWRIHRAVPRLGNIGVWNRSQYEDVLVVRVLNLVPETVWRRRFDQINAFEKHLVDNGYAVLKFFLHVSKEEQAVRLKERLQNKAKNWKFEPGDLKMRDHWADFQKAYEDILNKCSTPHAPWHVVPADRNWYRDFLVTRRVCEAMEELQLKWPKAQEDLLQFKVV